MRVLVVGCGAIGTTLVEALGGMGDVEAVLCFDAREGQAERAAERAPKARAIHDFDTGLEAADLVVEAASQEAVRAFGPRVLRAGRDLVVVSSGALADDALRATLLEAARSARRTIHVPSGAIGGLDVVRAAAEAELDEVTLTTAKPPSGLGAAGEGITGETVLFEGAARDAVKAYPKNVNVAASLSLAGVGFDRTRVRVVADPTLTANTHTVTLRGAFGEAQVRVENRPFPQNPATSHLAALSAIALLRRLVNPLQVG